MIKTILNRIKSKKLFKKVSGLPFDLKLKVSNDFEKRHHEVNEGDYLKLFMEYCSKQSCEYLYDVGGHIGIFSLTAALSSRYLKQVFVFEPTPWNYKTLEENIAANKLKKKIRPFNIALGKDNYTSEIQGVDMSGWGGSSFLREAKDGERRVKVAIMKGDDLTVNEKLPVPSLIKIDVEGFEFDVLKGFSNILKKHKPVLFIEYHPEYLEQIDLTEQHIHDYLGNLGYNLTFRQKWERGEQYQTIYE